MAEDPIFQVTNHHTEDCGKPPHISNEGSGEYRGYFENEHGGQAIFVYNLRKHEGILYMGDAGWETPHRIVDGVAKGLILGEPEQAWLAACWRAATAFG